MKKFLRDESGQTTTEYVLILAAVVVMALGVATLLKGRIRQAAEGVLNFINAKLSEATN